MLALVGGVGGAAVVELKRNGLLVDAVSGLLTPAASVVPTEQTTDYQVVSREEAYIVVGYTYLGEGLDIGSLMNSPSGDYKVVVNDDSYMVVSGPDNDNITFNTEYPYGIRKMDINGPGIVIDGTQLPPECVQAAYLLYMNKVAGLDSSLAPFALGLGTTESGTLFEYIATGGNTNFSNVAPRVVSKQQQYQGLQTIAGWVGNNEQGINRLCIECGRILGRQITTLLLIGCSNECAVGPKQFLPTTWVGEVIKREGMWSTEQISQFIGRLKDLGVISRDEVKTLRDFNPFVFSEAFVMAMLYMQSCGIKVDGTNFSGWNQSSGQARLAVARYKVMKVAFDRIAA